MKSCSNQKSVKQIKIYFIFEILQSIHPLPWWQLCTLLEFSPLECISINRCALLKVHLWNFFPSYCIWANQLCCDKVGLVDRRYSEGKKYLIPCWFCTFAHWQIHFISPLFNQVGKLRTSSHLQLRPGQDKAKQFDTYNDTELHME